METLQSIEKQKETLTAVALHTATFSKPQSQAKEPALNVLVLGAGNILLSDEGVGVRVVEALQDRYDVPDTVEILDGGTCGMGLLDVIAGRDHLIIVDAVNTGSPSGTLVRLADDEIPVVFRTKSSPHQLGLQDVLALLTLLERAPRHVTVIGVQPASLDLGLDLSPVIAACVDEMVAMVVRELASVNLPAGKKSGRQ
jgi:hydrogenase maturation protease